MRSLPPADLRKTKKERLHADTRPLLGRTLPVTACRDSRMLERFVLKCAPLLATHLDRPLLEGPGYWRPCQRRGSVIQVGIAAVG
jgi:hypothetical protein